MAYSMIRARMTLNDGKTIGTIRYGSANILVCIAQGCKIVPDPMNVLPEGFGEHVDESIEVPTTTAREKRKRNKRNRL